MRSSSMRARVRDALALRDAIMPVISRVALSDAVVETLKSAPARNWDLLLRAESCALPLATLLRSNDVLRTLPPDTANTISTLERAEIQRVLAARTVVRDIDVVLKELGVEGLLLKGGVAIADSKQPPLDLGDIDVLVAGSDLPRTWDSLVALGRTALGRQYTPHDVRVRDVDHFSALRHPEVRFSVELHDSLSYSADPGEMMQESRPIPGLLALRGSGGVAALAATLRHSVVHHPHRRGHVRDLLLLSGILRGDPSLHGAAAAALRYDAYAPELLEMLEQARAHSTGSVVLTSAAQRKFVAHKYVVALHEAGLSRVPQWRKYSHLALERRDVRRVEYATMIRACFKPVGADSRFRIRALEAISPGIASALSTTARVGYRFAVAALLLSTGWIIRRRIARLV